MGFNSILGVCVSQTTALTCLLTCCNHSGLFLSSGRVIGIAGPGLGLIAYILVVSLMWYGCNDRSHCLWLTADMQRSVMGCLEEMTAAHPVRGATFEFVARFTSRYDCPFGRLFY
jgi:amino acid permease